MTLPDSMIGREVERRRLEEALRQATAGQGALVLIAGEAGIGKTSLMDELAAGADVPVLRGVARPGRDLAVRSRRRRAALPPARGPRRARRLRAALRAPARAASRARRAAPRRRQRDAAGGDALRARVDRRRRRRPARPRRPPVVGRRDPRAAHGPGPDALRAQPARPRRLPLRRARARASTAPYAERAAPPALPRGDLARAARRGGDRRRWSSPCSASAPSRPLLRLVHDRSQGVPFFVEELACALLAESRLQPRPGRDGARGRRRRHGAGDGSRRGAAALRRSLTGGQEAAEAAAVAGPRFALDPVVELAGEPGVGELLEHGILAECGDGWAAFRHALVRDALYRDVPWLRRRDASPAARRAPGGDRRAAGRDRHALARRARRGARAAAPLPGGARVRGGSRLRRRRRPWRGRALELWPEDEDVDGRLGALERLAAWAELAGELGEAARAWREAASILDAGRRPRGVRDRAGGGSAGSARSRATAAGAIDSLTAAADAFADGRRARRGRRATVSGRRTSSSSPAATRPRSSSAAAPAEEARAARVASTSSRGRWPRRAW